MLDEAWDLSPAVSLRPEPFGAMAYHFGNRKLTFLKRLDLVEVVRGLARHATVRSALQSADVAEKDWPAFVAALENLASTDMLRPRTDVQREVA